MANTIKVSVLGEVRDINNKLGQVNSSLGKVGKVAKLAGAGMAAALAGGAAISGLKSVVSAASDAQQSLGATRTVFGKYADTVIQRSNEAAKSIGLSANEYRELSNVVGASLTGAGVPLAKTAEMTDKLNKRAADLAATFGGTTKEAVESFSSLLRGEADPIEKYGISVKQSDVNARLAAKGLDNLSGSALKQAEMQARLDLAFQQSSKTAGAFQKESGTLANQSQVLQAQFTNLKASLGSALLPVLTSVLTVINNNFTPAVKAIGEVISPVVAKVKEFFSGLGQGNGQMSAVMGVFKTLGNTITTTIIPAVTQVATYLAGKLFPVFQQVVGIIQGRVIPIFVAVGTFIYGKLVPAVVAIAQKVGGNLKPVFEQLVATFQGKVLPAVNKLLGKLQEWGPTIGKVVMAVAKIVGKVLEFAAAILGKVLPPVIKFAGFLAGTLIGAIGAAIGIIVKIAGAVVDFGGAVIKGAQKVGQFAQTVSQKIADVVKWFTELPGKIKGAFSNAGSMLTEIGRNIISGLVNGLESARQWVIDKIQAITDSIPGWVKKRLGIASPSRVMKALGKWVSIGLGKGIEEGAGAIDAAMGGITETIANYYDKKFKKDEVAKRKTAEAVKSLKDEAKALRDNANARKKNQDNLTNAISAYNELVIARRKELGLDKTINDLLDENSAKLDNARSSLQGLKDAAADYIRTVKDGFVAFGNLSSLHPDDMAISSATITTALQDKVNKAQKFSALIQELAAQGLNQTNLDQLIQGGVDAGLATAQALAAGGPGAIAQVNSLTAQLDAAGTQLGATMSARFHDAGINAAAATVSALESQRVALWNTGISAAAGLVEGFESMGDRLERAGDRLAKKMVKAIKKALDIHSPSRVFKKIGKQTTEGLVIGLKDTAGVERASFKLGKAVENGFQTPTLHAPATLGNNAGGNTYNINVTAPATVDKAALGREIKSAITAFEKSGGRTLAL